MKKLFAILVAIAMVLTLTVTALADAGGRLSGDENNVDGKAINASSREVGTIETDDGEISRNTDGTVVEKLAEELGRDELAPYVFVFTPYPGTTGEVTIGNIEIRSPYEFLRVFWYEEGDGWHHIDGRYTPDHKVTFTLPDGFDGGPIAITVVRTTGGDVPVSPQTGEYPAAAYLLGAAVMAAACAAFVVKSRKAA